MKPLLVVYVRDLAECFQPEADCRVLNVVTPSAVVELRAGIEDGSINSVVLVGQKVAIGWRIYTTREVGFSSSCRAMAEVTQASGRIVQSVPQGATQ